MGVNNVVKDLLKLGRDLRAELGTTVARLDTAMTRLNTSLAAARVGWEREDQQRTALASQLQNQAGAVAAITRYRVKDVGQTHRPAMLRKTAFMVSSDYLECRQVSNISSELSRRLERVKAAGDDISVRHAQLSENIYAELDQLQFSQEVMEEEMEQNRFNQEDTNQVRQE